MPLIKTVLFRQKNGTLVSGIDFPDDISPESLAIVIDAFFTIAYSSFDADAGRARECPLGSRRAKSCRTEGA